MMPLIPQIIRSFAKSDDQFDLVGFVDSVNKEPSVVARLVGYANSAFNRGSREVVSVKDAVIRLGLAQTRGVVLALLVNEQFDSKQCPGYRPDIFWFTVMMRAQYTKQLLKYSPAKSKLDGEHMYCLSLVSDLGLLLLVSQYPKELSAVLDVDRDPAVSISQSIRELFDGHGIHFFTAQLSKFWGLPDSFVSTFSHIDDAKYGGQFVDQVSLLKISNYLQKQGEDAIEASADLVGYGFALSRTDLDNIQYHVNQQRRGIQSMSEYMR
ncbi:MAG: HDOD domain-containing protein [Gammaproteobacteria bacterium]|nr:HDOD domain-containing protein [Gammaproteobacteria bacterium]